MHVPKTPADEDDLPQPWKHQIGIAGQGSDMQPIAIAHRVDQAADDHLRRRVLRLHGRHDAGTLGIRIEVPLLFRP